MNRVDSTRTTLFYAILFVLLLETAVMHLIVRQHHPTAAWIVTLSTLSLIPVVRKRIMR